MTPQVPTSTNRQRWTIVASLLLLGTIPSAQDPLPDHLVIDERKIQLLESRLSAAAGRGYRLLGAVEGRAGTVKASPVRLHLERRAESPPLDYRIVAGPYSGGLEQRLNEEAARGFRVRPDGILKRAAPNLFGRGDDEKVVLILERDGQGPPNEYRLLSLGTRKHFRRKMAAQHREGFRFTGMRGFYGGWLLVVMERPIVEREITIRQESNPHFLLVDSLRRQTMYDEIADAVSRGYRIVAAGGGGFVGGGTVVLLEKTATPERRYAYLSLNETPEPLLEERLNDGGSQGYRFHPGLGPLFELMMERAPGARGTARYRTLLSGDPGRIASFLSTERADGFEFVGMYGESLVLERVDATAPRRGVEDGVTRPSADRP